MHLPVKSLKLSAAIILSLLLVPAFAADFNPATIHSDRGAWPVYRQWNHAEIAHFAKWIEHIYDVKKNGTHEQRLAKIERVLTDPDINLLLDPEFAGEPVNPQLGKDSMRAMHGILDCGKLTVSLSGYYAYRRGLPWMINAVRSGDGTDIRQSAFNIPTAGRASIEYSSPYAFFSDAVTSFCTGNFRIEPTGQNAELSDTVPVAINRDALMPGCLYYLDGHVLVVAKIDKYGEIYFLDSTTSSTRDIYTHNGLNAVTGLTPARTGATNPWAGCYRGFRMQRWPIAEVNSDGKVTRVRRRTDEEMKEFGYSTEQYEKLADLTTSGSILENDVNLNSFLTFVRFRMRTADKIDPIKVMEAYADQLLDLLERREELVQAGWHDALDNGPITFPEKQGSTNIFNAPGRWGAWTSAPIDIDVRGKYFYMMQWVDTALETFESAPDTLEVNSDFRNSIFTRGDLAVALYLAKNGMFRERSFTYTNSMDEKVTLSLLDVERRLYDLSFDPNHPPELRWGAPAGSAEAATARQMDTLLPNGAKLAMAETYRRQAYYRTLSYREVDESFLRDMFTEGFPVPSKFAEQLPFWKGPNIAPPLVPRRMRQAEGMGNTLASAR